MRVIPENVGAIPFAIGFPAFTAAQLFAHPIATGLVGAAGLVAPAAMCVVPVRINTTLTTQDLRAVAITLGGHRRTAGGAAQQETEKRAEGGLE